MLDQTFTNNWNVWGGSWIAFFLVPLTHLNIFRISENPHQVTVRHALCFLEGSTATRFPSLLLADFPEAPELAFCMCWVAWGVVPRLSPQPCPTECQAMEQHQQQHSFPERTVDFFWLVRLFGKIGRKKVVWLQFSHS